MTFLFEAELRTGSPHIAIPRECHEGLALGFPLI
jgi:hypothetical protein